MKLMPLLGTSYQMVLAKSMDRLVSEMRSETQRNLE